ncbi:hypothetical protein EVJ50_14325 [Synechococcus sp. RSCCF101]|uniref:hypothetical protein n=1 Tax=Synechococcus sp. RSCCF101 TaxID=2511069 RepID=UPI00124507E5|nr:hypothetical protein [Synechococcus sp. RSCCF101]QEY33235.1 hypothetical protein EVJ50_14325 [Synechococcus sp. RSCCF101]
MRSGARSAALAWGSSQAGSSLSLAATAWLVSGLSRSPLLNGLLPAVVTLPALLPLRPKPSAYGLQLLSLLMLLAASLAGARSLPAQNTVWLIAICFLASLLFGLGRESSQLPLQQRLLERPGATAEGLRSAAELGGLLGLLLTALLFPAPAQFAPALVLLLPLALSQSSRAGSGDDSDGNGRHPDSMRARLSGAGLLQGALFGGLFALLPLWVRTVDQGRCFDFAMVLVAYGLGRALWGVLPAGMPRLRSTSASFAALAALLGLTQLMAGWSAVALFVPIGLLAATSDAALAGNLPERTDPGLAWQVLRRSGAVGGLLGSVAMGAIAQGIGLQLALPLLLLLFLTMAVVPHSSRPRPGAVP